MPSIQLRCDDRPRSPRRRIRYRMRGLPYDGGVGWSRLRSHADRFPPDGRPHPSGLRILSRRRNLRWPSGGVPVVPSIQLRCDDRPRSPRRRIRYRMRVLPHDHWVGGRLIRSFPDGVCPDGGSFPGRLFLVSCRRRLRRHGRSMRFLPPARLRRDYRPEPPGDGVPDVVRDLPQHGSMGWSRLRPRPDVLPSDGRSPGGCLFLMSRRGRVQRYFHRMRLLPPIRLRCDGRSKPPRRRFRDRVRNLPHDDPVGRGRVRPFRDGLPADRGPRGDRMRLLPRGWDLRWNLHRLLFVPSGRL